MRKLKNHYLPLVFVVVLFLIGSCKKDLGSTGSSLYTPTSADATTKATLAELQQGYSLYISNCGSCHSLYVPESFTPSQWTSVLGSMAPKTQLSSSQIQLVYKYVSKGK